MHEDLRFADLDAVTVFARRFAGHLVADDVLLLEGELGTGKTTLVRALVTALGGDPDQVSSPTFTLLHRYEARIPIIHIDAYRLRGPSDLIGLGFDELSEGCLACIEWPERVLPAIRGKRLWTLRLDHAGGGIRQGRLFPPSG